MANHFKDLAGGRQDYRASRTARDAKSDALRWAATECLSKLAEQLFGQALKNTRPGHGGG